MIVLECPNCENEVEMFALDEPDTTFFRCGCGAPHLPKEYDDNELDLAISLSGNAGIYMLLEHPETRERFRAQHENPEAFQKLLEGLPWDVGENGLPIDEEVSVV